MNPDYATGYNGSGYVSSNTHAWTYAGTGGWVQISSPVSQTRPELSTLDYALQKLASFERQVLVSHQNERWIYLLVAIKNKQKYAWFTLADNEDRTTVDRVLAGTATPSPDWYGRDGSLIDALEQHVAHNMPTTFPEFGRGYREFLAKVKEHFL